MSKQTRQFRFTDASLRGLPLPPKPKQVDYSDSTVRGMGVRVSYGGRKTFFIVYGPAAKRQRISLGEFGRLEEGKLSLAEARRIAKAKLGAIATGESDPAAERREYRQAATVAELAADWIEAQKRKGRKSWAKQQRILDVDLLPGLGAFKVPDLSRRDVKRTLQKIADRPAPILANRAHEVLRAMLNWALVEDEYNLEANPAEKIERWPEMSRERWLSQDELGRYWHAIDGEDDPHKAAALKLCLLTAQRQGNVLGLHRDQLMLEDALWLVPAGLTKTGRTYKVPLSGAAVAILEGLLAEQDRTLAEVTPALIERTRKRNPQKAERMALARKRAASGFLFPGRDGDGPVNPESPWLKKAHQRTCERAKIAGYNLHDARHSFASHADAMGVPRLVWDGVLGHAGGTMADVYSGHSFADERRDCMERWASRIAAAAAENVVELRERRADKSA